MRFLETLVPETMAAVRLTLDWRVAGVFRGVAIAAGLTFGLAPALAWSRLAFRTGCATAAAAVPARAAIGSNTRSSSSARRLSPSRCWRRIAAAIVSTPAARSRIRGDNLLTLKLRCSAIATSDQRVAFVNAELEKIRAIPGVISAGAISNIPLTQTPRRLDMLPVAALRRAHRTPSRGW